MKGWMVVATMAGIKKYLSYAYVDSDPETSIAIVNTAGNVSYDRTATVSGVFEDWSSEDTAPAAGRKIAIEGRILQSASGAMIALSSTNPITTDAGCDYGMVARTNGELQRRQNAVATNFPTITYVANDVFKVEYDPADTGGSIRFYKNDVEEATMALTGVGTTLALVGGVSVALNQTGAEVDMLKIYR